MIIIPMEVISRNDGLVSCPVIQLVLAYSEMMLFKILYLFFIENVCLSLFASNFGMMADVTWVGISKSEVVVAQVFDHLWI